MKITGEITFTYESEDDAKVVYDSLEVDNENYLKSQLDNNKINYNINSEKLGSFLATVDDLIASEIVVEKILDKTKR
ncbi:KEOPS complex subunit Pcc1 [uncultured Methanobrevibacter sp.]|uniref:KEOPS complex subunit Pcc1 n=1 Tax=uncultured Methanobrevibacter sp. TaxID=253161 RepID=UPI0025E17BD3|nr:KEOPS complex subunit Pcc1 [uncultured Methanobrevibacter sp.]MDO5814430.1 KEOPS complex subunit Pcc1 [Methanobrevibacter sp.]